LSLSEQEKEKYEQMYKKFPMYNAEGQAGYLAEVFCTLHQKEILKGDTFIDFGCGRGAAAPQFLSRGVSAHLIDITEQALAPEIFFETLKGDSCQFTQSCLWELPESVSSADWVFCLDVLEHIPEEKVDTVLDAIHVRMKKGGMLNIALSPDNWGKKIGEILHLTVQSRDWWNERLMKRFSLKEISDPAHDQYTALIYPKNTSL